MSLIQDPSTGTAANVKNANTAPVSGDQALVVTISPNSGSIATTNLSVSATATAPPADATYIGGLVTTAVESGLTNGDMYALSLTTAGLLRVDGSNVTQPVSGTVAVTQSTSPWVSNISQFGGNNVVTGTGTGGAGIPRVTVSNDSNVLATQSGSWTVTANAGTGNFTVVQATAANLNATVTGTVTANIGTTNGLALDTSVNGILVSQGSTTSGEKGPLIQGAVTTASPAYTTAQTSPLSLTTAGALRIDGSAVTQPISGTVTANAGTGNFTVVQATAANLNATVTANGNFNNASVASTGAAGPASATYVGGAVTTAAPTYTTGQMDPLSLTTSGSLRVACISEAPTAAAVPANATFVGGAVQALQAGLTTGDIYPLSMTTAGLLRVDGSNVTQPVSGTVTSNQGTANSLANAWATKITDATNGPVAVKAASTAAVATDPALVVSISPNSHSKATIEPLYGTSGQTVTITLASLANNAARASTAVSNTTNLYEDVYLFVKITTAAAGVSATGYVNVYGYGTVDGGTNYPEAITGTDAAITLTSPPNLMLLAQINANTNGATKTFGPFSFCRLYGLDKIPASWGVVVVNFTGAAFNATAGNFLVEYQGVNGQLV
jgi:hypothetical protein